MTVNKLALPVFAALVLLAGCKPQAGDAGQQNAAPSQASITKEDGTVADASEATYQDLQGHPVNLSDYAGKKVFLNYWATWCAPCIREIPSIARAAAELRDENYVFLLASDEDPDTIRDFLADRGFEGNFLKLNGYFGSHGVEAVPSSMLYDEHGKLLRSWAGAFEWDSADMLAQLRNPAAGQ